MKRFPLVVLVVLTLLCTRIGFAQTGEEFKVLKEEVKSLKEGQTAVQKDIRDIRSLLGANQAQPEQEFEEAVIRIKGAPFKGDDNAKIVMIILSDFGCTWCGRYARDTFPRVENEFIKTGKVKYVFIDFPMNTTTFKAAEAANCASEQEKFWEMHDRLFANQSALRPTDLIDHAEAIGLDMPRFSECIESHKYSARIGDELSQGRQFGVNGAPTFFFGFAELGDKVRVVKTVKGGRYDALKDAIE